MVVYLCLACVKVMSCVFEVVACLCVLMENRREVEEEREGERERERVRERERKRE